MVARKKGYYKKLYEVTHRRPCVRMVYSFIVCVFIISLLVVFDLVFVAKTSTPINSIPFVAVLLLIGWIFFFMAELLEFEKH